MTTRQLTTTPTKPKRRQRCEFCSDLYHPEPDIAIRNVCPTCRPAMIEVWRLEYEKLLAGPWREYQAVVAPLARGQADLVLVDDVATRFHAVWRLVPEDQKPRIGREIKRLAAENRRASMQVVTA